MGILDLIKEGCYSSCHVNSALGWECHQQKNCPCCSKVALEDLWLPRLVWILSGLRDTHGSCSKQLSGFWDQCWRDLSPFSSYCINPFCLW